MANDRSYKCPHCGRVYDIRWDERNSDLYVCTSDDCPGNVKVRCDCCEWTGTEAQIDVLLADVPDLNQRIAPGEVVPIGECPECHALVHQIAQDERTAGA